MGTRCAVALANTVTGQQSGALLQSGEPHCKTYQVREDWWHSSASGNADVEADVEASVPGAQRGRS